MRTGPIRCGLWADGKTFSPANAVVRRTGAGVSCRDTDEEMTEFAMQNHIKIGRLLTGLIHEGV